MNKRSIIWYYLNLFSNFSFCITTVSVITLSHLFSFTACNSPSTCHHFSLYCFDATRVLRKCTYLIRCLFLLEAVCSVICFVICLVAFERCISTTQRLLSKYTKRVYIQCSAAARSRSLHRTVPKWYIHVKARSDAMISREKLHESNTAPVTC